MSSSMGDVWKGSDGTAGLRHRQTKGATTILAAGNTGNSYIGKGREMTRYCHSPQKPERPRKTLGFQTQLNDLMHVLRRSVEPAILKQTSASGAEC